MKSIILFLIAVICSGNLLHAQTYFYSNNLSSDFNELSGWGTNPDGTGINPVSLNNNCILVLSHTKTSSGIATIRSLHIKSGGILYSNYSIYLDGTAKFFRIDSGGTYVQQHVGSLGSALFSGTEIFERGSIVEFRQWPSVIPGASWGYLKFDNVSNHSNCQLSGNTSIIKNDLIINSGNGSINLSAAASLNLRIEGNLEIQNGTLDVANSAGINTQREIHLLGNLKINNGTFKCTGNSNPVSFYFEGNNDSLLIGQGVFNTSNFKINIATGSSLQVLGDFNINPGCSLELASGQSTLKMHVPYMLINNGQIITNGGKFDFLSDTSGSAMLGESSGTISGNMTFNQTIPAGYKRYRFLSSPIVNGNFTDLIDDIFITGQGGKLYGFDSTQTNNSSAFYYDETVDLPNANYGWEPINQINTNMNSGKGFRVLIRGDRSNTNVLYQNIAAQSEVNLDFTGTPNSGNISINPIANFTSSGDAAADGWNLMGNPYPCQIDWNKIYDQSDFNNVNPSIYQRDASSGNYVAWNAASNNGTGSQFISAFGGFLIQFNNTPSGSFKENHKSNETAPLYFKKGNERILIEVKEESGSDLLLIGNQKNAIRGFNQNEDILKLFAGNTFIASKSSDHIWLCSDLRQIDKTDTIDLIIGAGGKIKFNILEKGENTLLNLWNKNTGKMYALKLQSSIEIEPGTLDSTNWKLLVQQSIPNSLEELEAEQISIFPNPTENMLWIENTSQQVKIDEMKVFDMNGKIIFSQKLSLGDDKIGIETEMFKSGLYILEIKQTSGRTIVKKFSKI